MKLRAAVAMLITSTSANAQGTIKGFVGDSVRAAPLASAVVVVDGNGAQTFTRADGTFEFASVAPGTHKLYVYHPFLDSLGIGMETPQLVVRSDSTTNVALAVPSAVSLVRLKCGS